MYQVQYKNKIKLYADGADFDSIMTLYKDVRISGFTTNPSLMKKAGVAQYTPFCKKVLENIKDKPISFEVFADEFAQMKAQAQQIATWGENVYVKIPVINSKGISTTPLISELSQAGIKLNITAIFTWDQIKDTISALQGGAPSIVSIFAGRMADAGVDPMPIVKKAVELANNTDKNIEVLWASTREPFNIIQAEQVGCHIITVPPGILVKIKDFGKDMFSYSQETVMDFKKDAESLGYTI